ncbi:DeoR/GlpR family DNA-binding transcription regulator [Paenibacillus sp. NPDC056579]|uniref:DeoR/GlpR family DNA-binding transcription regulator n=1 Tax=unclassified Paenibacillus TaxID=185978 RepID=UPI001EF79B2D|nr:DeoR/GlpR family DNA-binding transcription regulator [Paenibacillus sp. H1-7]ULL18217.1 DeoR/GlpR transcriptional regulator [Paenibacillus sp. H1-7]
MSLLGQERKEIILQTLLRDGKVKVIPMAEQLGVSTETIRRDLDALESEGKLQRVYGGAVRSGYEHGEPTFQQRTELHVDAKKKIGQRAAELIENGDTIALDVGTTMMELARSIVGKKNLTILTNSLPIASYLSDALNHNRFTGKVIVLGGQLNPEQQSLTGPLCEQMMGQFYLNKAFLSIGGLSLAGGVTDYDMNEAYISRQFAGAAREVIVLADQSKVGVQAFTRIAPLDDVDIIVSDQEAPKDWNGLLEKKGILWLTCE